MNIIKNHLTNQKVLFISKKKKYRQKLTIFTIDDDKMLFHQPKGIIHLSKIIIRNKTNMRSSKYYTLPH